MIEPRTHLFPRGATGHFNVLRGATPDHAGVKVVGDFVDNHRLGLPSELALLLLMDPLTGVPTAILDATAITEMRTGAVTAIGAEQLARRDARVLGHIGARGTAYWNVRLLARVLPELQEVRVHSRRPESREGFAARLRADLGLDVRAVDSWEECVRGADVVVEASRLTEPTPLLRTEWISPGALVVPYGTVSAVELSLTDIMDMIVVDDWGQAGSGPLGALRAHVDSGRLSQAEPARRARRDRGRRQARPRAGAGDDPLLAPGALDHRRGARRGPAGQGRDPSRPPVGTQLPYR